MVGTPAGIPHDTVAKHNPNHFVTYRLLPLLPTLIWQHPGLKYCCLQHTLISDARWNHGGSSGSYGRIFEDLEAGCPQDAKWSNGGCCLRHRTIADLIHLTRSPAPWVVPKTIMIVFKSHAYAHVFCKCTAAYDHQTQDPCQTSDNTDTILKWQHVRTSWSLHVPATCHCAWFTSVLLWCWHQIDFLCYVMLSATVW